MSGSVDVTHRAPRFSQQGVQMTKLDASKVMIHGQSRSLASCLTIKEPEAMAEAVVQNIS